jgi:hypothetical protein
MNIILAAILSTKQFINVSGGNFYFGQTTEAQPVMLRLETASGHDGSHIAA